MTATWTWVLAIFISSFLTIAHCLHSEATALELYESSDIGITILTSATFNATIFSSHTEKEEPVSENLIWFVQFYNTWCGHCQRFAPTWKSLANTTLAWQKSLRLAVLDCSKRENAPVCNQYGVSSYPTMKFFPPRNKIPGNSTNYLGPHTEPGVYLGMLDYMTKIKYPEEIVAVQPKSLGDLWRDDFPNVIDHVALLLESPDSKLGRDVVLSVVGRISYLGLTVRRTTTLNKVLLESLGENVDKEGIRLWLLERHGQKTRIGWFIRPFD
jgi:thiol-disulfide isomerase/thioredoxin